MLPKKAHALSEKVIAILVLAISLGVLAFGGILAANYTSANWLQLLYMTSPLLVALLARAVLEIPIEPALWPSLVLTLLGSGACCSFQFSQRLGMVLDATKCGCLHCEMPRCLQEQTSPLAKNCRWKCLFDLVLL